MAGIMINEGKLVVLQLKADYFNGGHVRVRLFKNNHVPAAGDTLASYTQANFDGYADRILSSFGAPVLVGDTAVTTHSLCTFTPTGTTTPNDIYGYIVFDNTLGKVLFAELDALGPVTVGNNLRAYTVTLEVTEDTA